MGQPSPNPRGLQLIVAPLCRFPEEGSGEAVPAAEVHQQTRSQEAGRETGIKGLSGEISYITMIT